MAETMIGLYKTEEIYLNGPRHGLEDVEFATACWVEWFNNRRLLGPIGDIPPNEYEAMYYQNQRTVTEAVALN
jgi:transposase InsO family protein